jgi:hypothetical protein
VANKVAPVISLHTRREVPSDGEFHGLVCPECGSGWWNAAVTLELTGLIGAFSDVSCRDCGTPLVT